MLTVVLTMSFRIVELTRLYFSLRQYEIIHLGRVWGQLSCKLHQFPVQVVSQSSCITHHFTKKTRFMSPSGVRGLTRLFLPFFSSTDLLFSSHSRSCLSAWCVKRFTIIFHIWFFSFRKKRKMTKDPSRFVSSTCRRVVNDE